MYIILHAQLERKVSFKFHSSHFTWMNGWINWNINLIFVFLLFRFQLNVRFRLLYDIAPTCPWFIKNIQSLFWLKPEAGGEVWPEHAKATSELRQTHLNSKFNQIIFITNCLTFYRPTPLLSKLGRLTNWNK